jgi:hypothetical protein
MVFDRKCNLLEQVGTSVVVVWTIPHGTRVPMVLEYHGTSMVVTSEWVSK